MYLQIIHTQLLYCQCNGLYNKDDRILDALVESSILHINLGKVYMPLEINFLILLIFSVNYCFILIFFRAVIKIKALKGNHHCQFIIACVVVLREVSSSQRV